MSRAGVGLRSERGPILLAVMLATGIVAIDGTILSTAVPSVVRELGGFSQFPWLFSIYLLASAVTVPVYSKLSDQFGRKPIMLIGIAVFLVASVLCAMAWDMPSLIVFRALQGIGAGAIQPMALTILSDIYSLAERAKVQAYVASVWATASIVGPSLGGVFAEFDLWRWIFWINLPLCGFTLAFIWRRYQEQLAPRQHRIDYAGAVLVTLGSGAIILGALEGGHAWAWDSPISFGIFGLGIAATIAFLLVERRAAEPVLPLGLFRRRLISVSTLVNFLVGFGIIGLTAFVPTYLQVGAGVSALIAGFGLATFTIGWPLAATLVGRVFMARGFRFPAIIGAVLITLGATGLAVAAQWPSPWTVAALAFVIGFGFGWVALPSLIASQSSVGWEERGVVSGLIMFARALGQALGAALFGAMANAVILARGGDESDPATIIAGTTTVFVGTAVIGGLMLLFSLWMPVRVVEATAEESRLLADDPENEAR